MSDYEVLDEPIEENDELVEEPEWPSLIEQYREAWEEDRRF